MAKYAVINYGGKLVEFFLVYIFLELFLHVDEK